MLVPIEEFKKELSVLKPKIEVTKEKIPDIEAESIHQVIASNVHKKFAVSKETIIARLTSEKIDVLNL